MQSGLALVPGRRVSDAWTVPLLVGLGVYCVALAGARALLNDGDTISHVAIGRWILAHRAIPFHDPFTFTARGRSWVPHEWLSELVFAVLYDRLGWGGVVAAAGLSAATAFVLLTRALAMTLGPRRAAIGALAAFALTESHFLARPHVLAWPLLVVWMARVIGARDAGRVPSLLLLPIMILWCNLHGGFVVGLFFAGLLAAEAVLAAPAAGRLAALAGWGTFLACSTLAALVSPNGVGGLLLPFKMLGMKFALASISEWRSADFAGFDPLEAWIGLLILGGFTLAIRLPVSRILLLLLLLWAALVHVRNKELLGIVAPLLLAAPLARQLGPGTPAEPSQRRGDRPVLVPYRLRRPAEPRAALRVDPGAHPDDETKPAWPRFLLQHLPRPFAWMPASAALVLAVVGFFAGAWALDRRGLAPSADIAPAAALAAARGAGLDGHVFNAARFGGYLMLEGVPTFVDGRADLFGDAFLERYVAATDAIGNWLPELLDRYAVQWTLLEPASPAVGLLGHLPGWHQVYADPHAVIHRRAAPPAR